ncbi:hypothetical protein JZ751_013493 [Albula glossodonta]|uniref:E-selectin n=1 Tax=Albula glossodonta TaxID=121402 RepID=A0A8T2MS33_9TELE|nr:hypothetical protein JZ751_013493 [Albula glossodonta]
MLVWVHCFYQKYLHGLIALFVFIGSGLRTEVEAWTYNYSTTPNRSWNAARQWCRQHFTDMVAIQNQKEISYLNEYLPKNSKYYWIGIRKINDKWTWIGTNKILTAEAENWAKGEPNNKGTSSDCVEMYIKRDLDTAKWNDQNCNSKKGALCYTASCAEDSCSVHADCEETIGNYTCKCHPGFQGPRCEEAVACDMLEAPEWGQLQCADMHGSFRFNSSCTFNCTQGFSLMGAWNLQCQASGSWDSDPPSCQVVKCPQLTSVPARGSMNCFNPIEPQSFNSTCEFSCEEGFNIIGSTSIQCDFRGLWTNGIPTCKARQCDALTAPLHGNLHCSHPHEDFSYNSSCSVSCEEGFLLNGTASIQCTSLGVWTESPPSCQGDSPHMLRYSLSAGSGCSGAEGLFSAVPAQQCDALTAPLHGNLHCSHPHEDFSYNSSCSVSCEEGFLLNGTASIQCTSLGVWTQPLPLCQARQCLPLVAPERSQMNCSHPHSLFSFGSRCELGCEEGFVLQGAPTLQCTESGLWSHTAPSCQDTACLLLVAVVELRVCFLLFQLDSAMH